MVAISNISQHIAKRFFDKHSKFIFPLLLLAVLSSCRHHDLAMPANMHYVRVYINSEIKNVTTGHYNPLYINPVVFRRPNIMHLVLYNAQSGNVAAERYLRNIGHDERGTYYDGVIHCEQGKYKMVVYNFGTEATIVGKHQQYNTLEAHTDLVTISTSGYRGRAGSSTDAALQVHQPDHLLLLQEDVELQQNAKLDTIKSSINDVFIAESVVKSYYLQIKLRGRQYVQSVSGALFGVGRGANLSSGTLSSEPAYITFDFNDDPSHHYVEADNETMLYTTFSTFGIVAEQAKTQNKGEDDIIIADPPYPTDGHTNLVFNIITIDGNLHEAIIDISAEFEKPEAKEKQWLLLNNLVINAPEPTGGGGDGFRPGVDKWGDVAVDIMI